MKQIDGEEMSRLLTIDRMFNDNRGIVEAREIRTMMRGRLVDDEPDYEPQVEERYRRRQRLTTEHV